jgi:hypothetical protein
MNDLSLGDSSRTNGSATNGHAHGHGHPVNGDASGSASPIANGNVNGFPPRGPRYPKNPNVGGFGHSGRRHNGGPNRDFAGGPQQKSLSHSQRMPTPDEFPVLGGSGSGAAAAPRLPNLPQTPTFGTLTAAQVLQAPPPLRRDSSSAIVAAQVQIRVRNSFRGIEQVINPNFPIGRAPTSEWQREPERERCHCDRWGCAKRRR